MKSDLKSFWAQTLADLVALRDCFLLYILSDSENEEKKYTRCADPQHEFHPKMDISNCMVEKKVVLTKSLPQHA